MPVPKVLLDKAATRVLPVGSVAIMPPGDPMFDYAEGVTIIQLHGTGPWGIEYINLGACTGLSRAKPELVMQVTLTWGVNNA